MLTWHNPIRTVEAHRWAQADIGILGLALTHSFPETESSIAHSAGITTRRGFTEFPSLTTATASAISIATVTLITIIGVQWSNLMAEELSATASRTSGQGLKEGNCTPTEVLVTSMRAAASTAVDGGASGRFRDLCNPTRPPCIKLIEASKPITRGRHRPPVERGR